MQHNDSTKLDRLITLLEQIRYLLIVILAWLLWLLLFLMFNPFVHQLLEQLWQWLFPAGPGLPGGRA